VPDRKLPPGVLNTILGALEEEGWCTIGMDWALRAGLAAALPVIERDVRRRTAREVFALEAEDRKRQDRNRGPYGDIRSSLRRLARGEPLPEPHELRGGDHA
jgi:hypothetical protein